MYLRCEKKGKGMRMKGKKAKVIVTSMMRFPAKSGRNTDATHSAATCLRDTLPPNVVDGRCNFMLWVSS